MKLNKLPFAYAKELIEEADILLFRGPKFPYLGWFVAKYGGTPYSHVALASRTMGYLSCLEFKEFSLAREHHLQEEIDNGKNIDVFRVSKHIQYPFYSDLSSFFKKHYLVEYKTKTFTNAVAKKITEEARKNVGKKYGWSLIYKMVRTYVPGIRLVVDQTKEVQSGSFVCSTHVTYCYRKHFIDLCPFIADNYTKPADIAKSSVLNYLFTISKN